MQEFDRIARIFRPLSAGSPESLNLADDAAWLQPPIGTSLIATADALVAGVHFLGDEDPFLIAQKALRVNLSDLASMGAEPYGYLLTTQLPRDVPEAWLARFAEGLAVDQAAYGLKLLGGDSSATHGPITLSVTMLGLLPAAVAPLRRNAARVGDALMVTGRLGESALGLRCFQSGIDDAGLKNRYLLPEPRVGFACYLRDYASACMDISDGLLQDAGHLAAASQVQLVIDASRVPLAYTITDHFTPQDCYDAALAGGDDYELLFTVAEGDVDRVLRHARTQHLPCTQIGTIQPGTGVACMHLPSGLVLPNQRGWQHF